MTAVAGSVAAGDLRNVAREQSAIRVALGTCCHAAPMPDPHVEALHYQFKSRQPLDRFDDAQPLKVSLDDFDCELAAGKLVARPSDHFAYEQDARAALEPMLRSWEQAAFVSGLNYRIAFVFDYCEIIATAAGCAACPRIDLAGVVMRTGAAKEVSHNDG